MTDDVFQHHDRIIDDETDREGQRQERDVIDAEVAEIHHRKRADHRDGNGDARDQRGGERAQEEEDHQDDQGDREDEREFHVVHGLADGERAVAVDIEADGGGELRAKGGEQVFDAVDHLDGVGAGLALHEEQDRTVRHRGLAETVGILGRALVHEPARGLVVLDAIADVGDVGEADRGTVPVTDDDLFETVGAPELAGGDEGGGLVFAVQRPGGEVGVVGVERGADLVDADATGGEGAGIKADPHGVFLGAEHLDLGDAIDGRDALGEHRLGPFVDFGERLGGGTERKEENGVVGGVALPERGRVGHVARQPALHGSDGGLHVLRGAVDIAVEVELKRDRGAPQRAGRRHRVDAGNAGELLLERRRDR